MTKQETIEDIWEGAGHGTYRRDIEKAFSAGESHLAQSLRGGPVSQAYDDVHGLGSFDALIDAMLNPQMVDLIIKGAPIMRDGTAADPDKFGVAYIDARC